MKAKKKTKTRHAKRTVVPMPRDFLVVGSALARFVQITSHGQSLYALDQEGRVFIYVGHAWMRVPGDEDRVLPLEPKHVAPPNTAAARTEIRPVGLGAAPKPTNGPTP